MASCPAFLSSPLSLERPACVRELIAAVGGDAATFSVAGRSVVLQQGYDNSAYRVVLPSCCGRVAAYCSMIGASHFRRGRRFARAASSLLLLLLAYGACFGRDDAWTCPSDTPASRVRVALGLFYLIELNAALVPSSSSSPSPPSLPPSPLSLPLISLGFVVSRRVPP